MKLRLWSVSALAACCIAVASATNAFAQGTGVVKGTIVDSASRRPIEAAQVVIAGTTIGSVTNPTGQYIIRNVPAGSHIVRATRLGHSPVQRQVSVRASDSVVVDFAMRQTAATLSSVVVVGYGTADRKAVTNAVTTVRSE